ncbi:hypothetical protein N7457_006176 [Penicillium paradoxum]|uniref:uncharacterized protein n=1 Tax=Penicillium paradoxum TaxID=176176 RepID=UPI0025497E47|nr:uncharacterized protein N7457_006176 [Penicillium paradoxum]KAJ5781016.1 hypothetical protein N7457_006176 [Penicillium paradoxum]
MPLTRSHRSTRAVNRGGGIRRRFSRARNTRQHPMDARHGIRRRLVRIARRRLTRRFYHYRRSPRNHHVTRDWMVLPVLNLALEMREAEDQMRRLV